MHKYKLTIKPEFYMISASASADYIHDAVFLTDRVGLPYLQGATIKGLLRESMEDVLSMQDGKIDNTIINSWFGESGFGQRDCDILFISNAYIPDYRNVFKEIKALIKTKSIDRKDVTAYFSSTIAQTKIDDEGIADDGSLRKLRVLDYSRVMQFECEILTRKKFDKLFENAVFNLSYSGLVRNDGLGKIKCSVIEEPYNSPKTIDIESEDFNCLKLVLTTDSPLLMSTQIGDQNSISSENDISGSKIRGALASWYTQHLLSHDYRKSDPFLESFLSPSLTFTSARLRGENWLPFNIQKDKYDSKKIIDKFEPEFSKLIGKPIINLEPDKRQTFHNSRKDNRAAGASQGDDREGSIFYREFIEDGQEFHAYISGPKEILKEITNKFPAELEIRIGSSKSVQYGKVRVAISLESQTNDNISDDYLYFVCQTPCILMNEYNESEASLKLFCRSLGLNPEEVTNSFIRTQMVRSFNHNYGASTPTYIALAAGSVIKYHNKGKIGYDNVLRKGLWNHLGYGEIQVMGKEEYALLFKKLVDLYSGQNQEGAAMPDKETLDTINMKEIVKKIINNNKKLGLFDKILPPDFNMEISNSYIKEIKENLSSHKNWNDYLDKLKGYKRDILRTYIDKLKECKDSEGRTRTFEYFSEALKYELDILKIKKQLAWAE